MDLPKYRIEIFWSDEDGGYIANVPALRYCSAFGETYEEALREVLVAMELHLDTLRELDRPIPQSEGLWLSERFLKNWIESIDEQTQHILRSSATTEELTEAQRRAFQESSQEATEVYMGLLKSMIEEQQSSRAVPRRPAAG